MKRMIIIIPLALALSGCALFKPRMVPQAYMPDPPSILMKAPRELATIKKNKPIINEDKK